MSRAGAPFIVTPVFKGGEYLLEELTQTDTSTERVAARIGFRATPALVRGWLHGRCPNLRHALRLKYEYGIPVESWLEIAEHHMTGHTDRQPTPPPALGELTPDHRMAITRAVAKGLDEGAPADDEAQSLVSLPSRQNP